MPNRLFPSPDYPTVPVEGSGLYPVHRIFCVGRNYADHAAEMGVEVDRETPFYFLKDAQFLVPSGATIDYPPGTQNYHQEMELVMAIGTPVFRASPDEARAAIFGYACGLDMTRRDLQLEARAKGRPWDLGKNVEQSAVMAALTPAAAMGEIGPQRISLTVDGTTRQQALLSDLVWSSVELVAHLSRYYHLAPGDLIYTGTPAGVGPVVAGSVIQGQIDGLAPVELTNRTGCMRFHGYFRSSSAWRCRIAFNLKGVRPETIFVHLRRSEQRQPDYRALNPQALVPALTLDSGLVLTQSLAIVEWLDETYPEPPLLPSNPEQRALVRGFAQVIACDTHPLQNLRLLQHIEAEYGQDQDGINAWCRRWLTEGLAACEALAVRRAGGRFTFGETPGLADICLIPQLGSAARFGVDLTAMPRLREIGAAAAEHQAFAAAVPSGQPDAEA